MSAGTAPARCLRQIHAQHGIDFATRLRGAFAIAIWAPAQRRLVLAADRFGFRRMYYAVTEAGVAFGSRVKAPLVLPGCSQALDPDAIDAYLNFGTVPARRAFIKLYDVSPGAGACLGGRADDPPPILERHL